MSRLRKGSFAARASGGSGHEHPAELQGYRGSVEYARRRNGGGPPGASDVSARAVVGRASALGLGLAIVARGFPARRLPLGRLLFEAPELLLLPAFLGALACRAFLPVVGFEGHLSLLVRLETRRRATEQRTLAGHTRVGAVRQQVSWI